MASSSSTPAVRRRHQSENAPLSTDKPPLTRDGSVIQQVSTFIGWSSGDKDDQSLVEEKAKWDKKRLRRIATKYGLNENEASKFVRNKSITQAISSESTTTPSATPCSPEDVERGVPARIFARTPSTRAPIGPMPSIPSYETSFDGGRGRSDSFSQDLSQSQSRLSKATPQRESVPSAVFSSMSTFFKKGSFINKGRLKQRSSLASKCSFDMEVMPSIDSPTSLEDVSPAGITFMVAGGGESFEMKPLPARLASIGPTPGSPRRASPPESKPIPEETSFEVELEELGDVDEAQGEEMASDLSAVPRMTARVRRKQSSVKAPPLLKDAPVLQHGKTVVLERPTDLVQGTRPLMHPSTSLPSRVSSFHKKRSRQEDQVLELLAEESDKKDREEDGSKTSSDDRRSHPPLTQSFSLVDEVFFDSEEEEATPSEFPVEAISSYPARPASITVADTPVSDWYHQEGYITYIDIGDSTLNRPKATALGAPIPTTSTRPDRPLVQTTQRYPLVRQPTVRDSSEDMAGLIARRRRLAEQAKQFRQTIADVPDGRRQRGIGVFGKFFRRSYKDDLSPELKDLLGDGEDERPWFTYWILTIQILVCVLSIYIYGFGPIGYGVTEYKGEVMDTTLSNRRVSFLEPDNTWVGPHFADLIRLGALYSPCMRREYVLWAAIQEDRRIENQTGCCIANDRSGCWQSSEFVCPRNVARWVRWDRPALGSARRNFLKKSKSEGDLLHGQSNITSLIASPIWTQQRKSGAVCGQDPSYCASPLSVAPQEWPDDITQWPICERQHQGAGLPEHVTCQVTGRPCCIQMQGLCRIATKDYCNFVRGHWHENATLCSQVNCFSGVCGMLPFFGSSPNQFYRLFTSLFIHAGVAHLVFTIIFQWWAMRDLERLIGTKRMALLYIVSGVGGNLASAIFVPYSPAVGPSGSQCGILAAMIVDCYHHRLYIKEFGAALQQHAFVTAIVFAVGLVPWVDNWAHLFGSLFGLLITIITFPYLDFPDEPPPETNTVPMTPSADTPASISAARYSQLASSPINEPGTNIFQPINLVWGVIRRRFGNRRSFYVFLAAITLTVLFVVLAVIFFGNIQVDCPLCIYLNCLPIFECHNQGQKLKKWLPI